MYLDMINELDVSDEQSEDLSKDSFEDFTFQDFHFKGFIEWSKVKEVLKEYKN